MAYYTALINAWNSVTQPPAGVNGTPITGGMTTAQKVAAVNTWTVTGVIPTSIDFTGNQLANCINYTEFKALTAQQQDNVLALCGVPGSLLGGSANTAFAPVGMIIDYFLTHATISSGTYNSSTGAVVLTMSAPITFGVGGSVTVSGLTGTGAFASLNGIFPTIATTSGSTVTYNAGAGLGASTITGGSLTPPTVTALTQLAQATVTPWWQAPASPGPGGGLTSPVSLSDAQAAGLS